MIKNPDFTYVPVRFSQNFDQPAKEWNLYYISFPNSTNLNLSISSSDPKISSSDDKINENTQLHIDGNDYIYFSTDINQSFFSIIFLPMLKMELIQDENNNDKHNCIKFTNKILDKPLFYLYSYDTQSFSQLIQYIYKSINNFKISNKYLTSSIIVKPTIIVAMKQTWKLEDNGNILLEKKSGIQNYSISKITQLEPIFDTLKPNCFLYSTEMKESFIERYFDIEEWKSFIRCYYNNITKKKSDSTTQNENLPN